MTRKVAYVYGSRTKTFLSGTPYYLARALEAFGKKNGAFDVIDVMPKRTREIPLTYLRWCLEAVTNRISLFLLSQTYTNGCTRNISVPKDVTPYFIIWGQYIPSKVLAFRRKHPGARIILYNDATLLDLMETFDYALQTPPPLRVRMVRNEKISYAQSDLIAVFHEKVRARMIKDYGVPPEKIWVIGRGANLDNALLRQSGEHKRSVHDNKFHMMIVGRSPKRKGVFRLIEAIDALTPGERDSLVLTVAGPSESELPTRPYLRTTGFVSADERDLLVAEMAASDLGVLLSDADSLPGSIWEFLVLKVPVWVSNLPGIATALEGYPAIIEDLSQGTSALTARLRTFLRQPQMLSKLRTEKTKSIRFLTWNRPAEFLGEYIRTDSIPAKWRDHGAEVCSR